MRGHFAVLSSNRDIYLDLKYILIFYISLNSQRKELSELISYMKIGKELTTRGCWELENRFFNFYFWN